MKTKSFFLSCLILLSISAYAQTPVKKVLLEEFTTTMCGFCPPKSFEIIQWHETHPNSVFMTIHEGSGRDSMSNDLTAAIFKSLRPVGSWFAPAIMIDRGIYPSKDSVSPYMNPLGFDTIALRVMNEPSPVDIQILSTYDSTLNKIDATVKVKFVSQVPNGEYRINLFLVEDSVTGTGYPAYDQNCYDASFATTHYPNLSFTGGHIIGYPHRYVLRNTLTGDNWGTTATIPASPVVGETYVYTLSSPFSVPEKYSKTRLSLIASVNHYVSGSKTENYVLNANSIKLSLDSSTKVTNPKELASIHKIYPNPASDNLNIVFSIQKPSDIYISITDVLGKSTELVAIKNVNTGTYEIPLNTTNFSKGIYFITLQSTDATLVQKIVIQ